MATTAQQATFAAQKGKNWADPTDPNFGQAGYTGQSDYDAYNQQYGSPSSSPSPSSPSSNTSIPPSYPNGGGDYPTPPSGPIQPSYPPPSGGPFAPSYPNGGGDYPAPPPPTGPISPSTGSGIPDSAATPSYSGPGMGTTGGTTLPASAPQGTPQQPPAGSVDPFASSGGGVYLGNGQWVPANSPLAGGSGTATTSGGTTTAVPATTTGIPDTSGGGTTGADSTQFLSTLLGLLHPGTVDQNNPAISGAISANNLALQRGAEAQRAQQAEVNAQTGTDASGGANTTNQGIAEDMAAKQGQFAGKEVQHLSDQQNQNEMAAITALGGYLPQQQQIANQWAEHESSLSEQAREADIDAALKKLGIQTQGALGSADIALRDKLGSSQEALTLLGLMLQNQQSGHSLDASTLLGLLNSLGG